MIATNGFAAETFLPVPSISVPITGDVRASSDGDPAECPNCGGYLDLCQPNMHDGTGDELVGACLDCNRLSYVVAICGSATAALLLPTRDEVGARALAVLSGISA